MHLHGIARCIAAPVCALKITVTNENRHFLISPTPVRDDKLLRLHLARECEGSAAHYAEFCRLRDATLARDRLMPVADENVIRNCAHKLDFYKLYIEMVLRVESHFAKLSVCNESLNAEMLNINIDWIINIKYCLEDF